MGVRMSQPWRDKSGREQPAGMAGHKSPPRQIPAKGHPVFMSKPMEATDGSLWAVTRFSGEAWVSLDNGANWRPFRIRGEKSPMGLSGAKSEIEPFAGTGSLRGSSRAVAEPRDRLVPVAPMPAVRNGDRRFKLGPTPRGNHKR